MMAVHNLKIARDKCPPPTLNPDNAQFKVRDMVLVKHHAPTNAFETKYKQISDKAFDA